MPVIFVARLEEISIQCSATSKISERTSGTPRTLVRGGCHVLLYPPKLFNLVFLYLSMFIELVIALIVGVLAGTFTGLFPGIHINHVAAGLLAMLGAGKFNSVSPTALVVFIVAMSITHTFADFIPSVFLGAPDEDTFLSVLPGHQLLTEGNGQEAVVLTLYGSLVALPITIVFSFIFVKFLPLVFDFI